MARLDVPVTAVDRVLDPVNAQNELPVAYVSSSILDVFHYFSKSTNDDAEDLDERYTTITPCTLTRG
jgi:hypothetical protein